MHRFCKQKISNKTEKLNDTIEQLSLLDIYIGYYIKKKNKPEYTFFPSAHGTVSRTDHIQGHKMNLNKFKNTETSSAILSDHNGMKLETHHRKE